MSCTPISCNSPKQGSDLIRRDLKKLIRFIWLDIHHQKAQLRHKTHTRPIRPFACFWMRNFESSATGALLGTSFRDSLLERWSEIGGCHPRVGHQGHPRTLFWIESPRESFLHRHHPHFHPHPHPRHLHPHLHPLSTCCKVAARIPTCIARRGLTSNRSLLGQVRELEGMFVERRGDGVRTDGVRPSETESIWKRSGMILEFTS